jgi:hypothetical protein
LNFRIEFKKTNLVIPWPNFTSTKCMA